jgi:hypothetical protein
LVVHHVVVIAGEVHALLDAGAIEFDEGSALDLVRELSM